MSVFATKATEWAERTVSKTWTLLSDRLVACGPPLTFGLRLWASVCLALYVAFWLQLDDASWAGTTAALMCQPQLGASLRKGWFRMIGTLIGAVAIVVLTACFPQDRVSFLAGVALWGGACAFAATLLRNFAAYSAALAGYTVAIIASDQLGATGGVNGQAFMLAVTRVQRDLHRHRLRRYRSRRDRSWGRTAPAGHIVGEPYSRDHGQLRHHVEVGWARTARHTTDPA